VLERWQGGVRLQQVRPRPRRRLSPPAPDSETSLLQVAAQDLAFGIKFSATATLDIEELPDGILAAGAAPQQAAKRCARPACGVRAGCDPALSPPSGLAQQFDESRLAPWGSRPRACGTSASRWWSRRT
jgi:hypothetical protein